MMRQKFQFAFVWGMGLLLCASSAADQVLSNVALFYRCYGQITQAYPTLTDPKLAEVKAGKNALTACQEILDSARFTASSGTRMAADSVTAKSVLATMHKLHASWFSVRDYSDIGGSITRDMANLYDVDSPAFFFDRALFKPDTDLKTVLLDNDTPRAIRTTNNNTVGAYAAFNISEYLFTSPFSFADKGELLGIDTIPNANVTYAFGNLNGTINFGVNSGGGIIGSSPYLMLTVNEDSRYAADGALNMPRKWARSVLSDLFCRNLPVIAPNDGASFKVATSSVAFRQSESCLQCHATMDRMAMTIRNFHYFNLGDPNVANARGGNYARFHSPNHGAFAEWSSEPLPVFVPPAQGGYTTLPAKPAAPAKPFYNLTTPTGVFYMRDYQGNLINRTVSGVADMNTYFSTLPDFYICVAKRYYGYFMGVDVDLDPLAVGPLSETDTLHKNAVINLGKALHNNATDKQDVRKLIWKIWNLPQYKRSSFGAERGD